MKEGKGPMWQQDLVFPQVPRGFWLRFRRRWGKPLRALEEVISLSESLGADPKSPRFQAMDEAYCGAPPASALTRVPARPGSLRLLSVGLVDPAWAQWRICHESSTIARFIANTPEMASRYMRYSLVNKYYLAKELYDSGHSEAPTMSKLDELQALADVVNGKLLEA